MEFNRASAVADVCLVLEGTYPFVRGGVASWAHELIRNQPQRTFAIVTIVAPDIYTKMRYELPENVISLKVIKLQELPKGRRSNKRFQSLFSDLEPLLLRFQHHADLEVLRQIESILLPFQGDLGSRLLLESSYAWDLVQSMYKQSFCGGSFLDYFWSWRCLMSGLFSVLLTDLPIARLYHTLCTGYAGIFAARASIRNCRPMIVTEHGLYTNERRIELGTADWFHDIDGMNLSINSRQTELRELWGNTFSSYSRICYQAADKIVTLFDENSHEQRVEGADPSRQMVIPNGIDVARFGRKGLTIRSSLSVAIIGRVVPIKGVKTFIQSAAIVLAELPEVKFYIIGPSEEDSQYYRECRDLVDYFGLNNSIQFTGSLDLTTVLPELDLVVLTSLSEAQPLVILEAGASGVPVVATDVGSCRELILGKAGEEPSLGPGGAIAEVANVQDVASKMLTLLKDRSLRRTCGDVLFKRVSQYYTAQTQHTSYRTLYDQLLIEEVESVAPSQAA